MVEEGVEESPLEESSIDIQAQVRHLAYAFLSINKHAKGLNISFLNMIY